MNGQHTGPAQALTVTLNPAIDQLVTLDSLQVGQVQRARDCHEAPGGKGINVASCLADWGVATAALGVLGSGNAGMFEALFTERGIDDACVRAPGQTRTNIKLVSHAGTQTTDINLPGLSLTAQQLDAVSQRLAQCLRPGQTVVLSGSLPDGLPEDSWSRLQAQVAAAGARVLLDINGAPLAAALSAADGVMPWAIKPNRQELQAATGVQLDDHRAIGKAVRILLDRGIGLVVVSMGEDGALFACGDAALLARPPRIARGSSVGAGDAMVAGIVAACLRDEDLQATARIATAFSLAWLEAGASRRLDPARVATLAPQVALTPFAWNA